jgi:phage terminase large subunit-like protein
LIHALELLPDGRPRFRTVLVLVARQNGKTALLVVLALFWLFVQRRPLVLGTSTNLDYARESWEKAVALVEEIDDLSELVPQPWGIRRTNGEQTLTTSDRCRYKIATASRRGGRSLTVHNLILDELREHHDYSSWAAATKAMNAVADGQVWALSNAGDETSVPLNDLQKAGRAGANPRLGLFEWSIPDGTRCTCGRSQPHGPDCALQDRALWAMANPSLGHLIDPDVIQSDLDTDPVATFLTEDCCVRVKMLDPSPIDLDAWAACGDPGADKPAGARVFCVDVSPDHSTAAISAAGYRIDGLPQVEVVEHRDGTDWLVARMVELDQTYQPLGWVMDASGAATSFVEKLRKAGFQVVSQPDVDAGVRGIRLMTSREMGQACGALQEQVTNGGLRHVDDPSLNTALGNAAKTDIGDGLWKFSRRRALGDICPLVSATCALWRLSLVQDRSYDVLGSVW